MPVVAVRLMVVLKPNPYWVDTIYLWSPEYVPTQDDDFRIVTKYSQDTDIKWEELNKSQKCFINTWAQPFPDAPRFSMGCQVYFRMSYENHVQIEKNG